MQEIMYGVMITSDQTSSLPELMKTHQKMNKVYKDPERAKEDFSYCTKFINKAKDKVILWKGFMSIDIDGKYKLDGEHLILEEFNIRPTRTSRNI